MKIISSETRSFIETAWQHLVQNTTLRNIAQQHGQMSSINTRYQEKIVSCGRNERVGACCFSIHLNKVFLCTINKPPKIFVLEQLLSCITSLRPKAHCKKRSKQTKKTKIGSVPKRQLLKRGRRQLRSNTDEQDEIHHLHKSCSTLSTPAAKSVSQLRNICYVKVILLCMQFSSRMTFISEVKHRGSLAEFLL